MRRMTGNGGGHGTVRAEKLLPKTKRTEGNVLLFLLLLRRCVSRGFPVFKCQQVIITLYCIKP